MSAQVVALVMALAAAGQAPTADIWSTITPPGAGFTIQTRKNSVEQDPF